MIHLRDASILVPTYTAIYIENEENTTGCRLLRNSLKALATEQKLLAEGSGY